MGLGDRISLISLGWLRDRPTPPLAGRHSHQAEGATIPGESISIAASALAEQAPLTHQASNVRVGRSHQPVGLAVALLGIRVAGVELVEVSERFGRSRPLARREAVDVWRTA